MKPVCLLLILIVFIGCGKSADDICIKGEVIATDCCGTWAVNITDGPAIGVKVLNYSNVIQLHNMNTANITFGNPGTTIYFKIRNIKKGEIRPCLLYCATIGYSPVGKIATAISLTSCQ